MLLCLVSQLCPTLCNPMDLSPPGSSVQGDSQGKNTGLGCHAFSRGLSQPREKPRSPALQADYLLSQPLRKPITTLGKAQSSEFFSQPRAIKQEIFSHKYSCLVLQLTFLMCSRENARVNQMLTRLTCCRGRGFSVLFSLVAQSCLTLCNPMGCNTPGFAVHHQPPEPTQTHVL